MVAQRSVDAMRDAGLWRLLTPTTWGGAEAGLRAQVDSLFAVAAADPAAGWVQMVSNAHAWMVGGFPEACQAEIFGDGPDVVVPGTLAAQGQATRRPGGWELSGRWQFASGVDHGDWLLIGAIADELAGSDFRGLHLIVPKSDIEVDDTWHTLGLRGTGSKDLVAGSTFVPEHRAMPTGTLFNGMSEHGEVHSTHLNRLPVIVCLSVQLAAAVLGIAESAVQMHIERTAGRREVYTPSSKSASVGTQTRIAESCAELKTARLLIGAAAERCDELGVTGERLDIETRVELRWNAAYAVELSRRATDRVFAASGAHAVYNDSQLQSRYRDINTACHHAIADFEDPPSSAGASTSASNRNPSLSRAAPSRRHSFSGTASLAPSHRMRMKHRSGSRSLLGRHRAKSRRS